MIHTFHQHGHLAHYHVSGLKETQRQSLSSLRPWGLIFKGAFALCPHMTIRMLWMPWNHFQFNSIKWKFMESISVELQGRTFYDYYYWLQ